MPRRARAGTLDLAQAERLLRASQVRRVGTELKLDLSRAQRTGIPEVVIAEGKMPEDVRAAALAFLGAHGRAIVTRVDPRLRWGRIPRTNVERHHVARVDVLRRNDHRTVVTGGRVAILTGGASDRRVAAEAEVIARELGCEVRTESDVGVATLQRALDALADLEPWRPHVYVVAAGREGALAPVVAGLVNGPVIGLPVSTGYGHRGKGEAALSTMLQSCAPLVTVNIDAGFVAGAVAAQIANRIVAAAGLQPARRKP